MMQTAPIALFVYKRPFHTERVIDSLRTNVEAGSSELFIFSDSAKSDADEQSVKDVRKFLRTIKGFKAVNIVERPSNLGLADSVVIGVTKLCDDYGRVIVVEDDLIVSPHFLAYMNAALERYKNNLDVMQISGYQFPVEIESDDDALFLPFTTTWGWGTWKRAWNHFDNTIAGYDTLEKDRSLRKRFDLDDSYPYFRMLKKRKRGAVDSWGIVWYLSVFLREGLTLYPKKSLVKNIGFDGTGTHCGSQDEKDAIDATFQVLTYPFMKINLHARDIVFNYLRHQNGFKGRIKNLLCRLG